MGTPNANVAGKFATDVDAAGVSGFDANSKQYEFQTESMRMVQTHVDSVGVRGTRSRVKDHVRIGREDVGGSVSMMLTPTEFRDWWPRVLGTAESGTDPYTYAVAETLPSFSMLFERGAGRFVYTGCKVGRAVFSGTPNQLITCNLDILGKTEVIDNATVFPVTVPAIAAEQPFVFNDLTFELGLDASAEDCLGFTLTIDNFLEPRFANSVTADEIFSTDRLVTLEMLLPHTADEVALLDQAIAGGTASMLWTNGGIVHTFTFANVKAPHESPITPSRSGERTMVLRMVAYMSGADREIVVVSDIT